MHANASAGMAAALVVLGLAVWVLVAVGLAQAVAMAASLGMADRP